MKEALFYKKLDNCAVQCQLCPHFCFIEKSKRGKCGVRENANGKLVSLVYEKLCSISVDPIEKKPLFHFKPGTDCLSIATVGCNLSCSFCQNWQISQVQNKEVFGEQISAKKVVELALEKKLPGIAYTYTEPLIAIEFYLEIMELAKNKGLYNVWVSNGFSNPKPVKKVSPYLDAINIDLKGNTQFYNELCGVPSERPIQETLKIYKSQGVSIEVTNLIISGFNDNPEQIKQLVSWIKENLGQEIPLHFSRFWPCYRMQHLPPTDLGKLHKAKEIAEKAGLKYVYIGNVLEGESTKCPKCSAVLIKRSGFASQVVGLGKGGECRKCGAKAGIIV